MATLRAGVTSGSGMMHLVSLRTQHLRAGRGSIHPRLGRGRPTSEWRGVGPLGHVPFTRDSWRGHLLVQKDELPTSIKVFVTFVPSDELTYYLHGWCQAGEAMLARYWREGGEARRPAYFIPPSELRDMCSTPGCSEAERRARGVLSQEAETARRKAGGISA